VTLSDLFRPTFERHRDQIGIEFDADDGAVASLTFGEIDARATQMARALASRGVERGDRVCVYLPNSVAFVELFLGCLKLGAIFVPINVLYREREIAHIVTDSDPRGVVTTAAGRSLMADGFDVWEIDALLLAARDQSGAPIEIALQAHDPAALIYTSGTTGRSKGAILSHANLVANANNLVKEWRIRSSDRYLAVLPLFHVHGLGNGIICWLASGCRMRLVERFELERAASLFEEFRPTLFFGVPTIYVRLLELPEDTARAIGTGMRVFVSGSAPLPSHVFEQFRDRFGHEILERYGMSETLINTSNPYVGERRAGTVGPVLPGVDARIVDEEIQVRGPNVFSGYWRRPDANATAFVDGWFRTGDLAERSDDGYYTLRGRRSDLIISGGFNVYPREIEEVLLEIPGVREAAVVGVADERRGEVPVAYIVSDAPIDAAALERECRQALASFKVPRSFTQVPALPRTALGKIQKHLLATAHGPGPTASS
jgi:malonyl-CoA/methylmalonyl-CoA synthetase